MIVSHGTERNAMNVQIWRKYKQRKLWSQPYVTSLLEWDIWNSRTFDFCWTECTVESTWVKCM